MIIETAGKRAILTSSVFLLVGGAYYFGCFHSGNYSSDCQMAQAREKSKQESNIDSSAKSLSALILGPETIADIAEKAAPSVVNISVEGGGQIPGAKRGGKQLFQTPFGTFELDLGGGGQVPFGLRAPNNTSTGTGFVVRSDGYILTNSHVIRGSKGATIKVTLNDKRSFEAKVVGTDNFSDLALLKIEAKDLPELKIGSSTNLRPGEFAIAIGSPLGYDHTVTLGIISAVGRAVDVNGNITFIQTDAAINRGNSGGPLLNLKGEVIGVNTAIRQDAQNIGFSIPADIAKQVADDLIAKKKIERPWLGIAMTPIDETMAKSLGISPDTKGVIVKEIFEGSPAMAAGMKQGDIILKIDGQSVEKADQVRDLVRAHKVSDTLNFYLIRDKAPTAVAVNIGQYPNAQSAQDIQNDEPGNSEKNQDD